MQQMLSPETQIEPDELRMEPLIRAYQRRHGMSDAELARHLRIDLQALSRLLHAQQPHPERRVMDILALAAATGCPAALLWGILYEMGGLIGQSYDSPPAAQLTTSSSLLSRDGVLS